MPETDVQILPRDPAHPDAAALMAQLNGALRQTTGCDGTSSFRAEEMRVPGAVFPVAYHGGLHPLSSGVAEVKRVYARQRGAGLPLLRALETRAAGMGYVRLVCETRRVNARAVAFYLRAGWRETPAYGRYVGRPKAICFETSLGSGTPAAAEQAPTVAAPGIGAGSSPSGK